MNERLIETVARAICTSNNLNPDEIIETNHSLRDGRLVLITTEKQRWRVYEEIAKHHIAASDAIKDFHVREEIARQS